jgi:RNA polymerase sigma-70 factor (ECF subfamily)
MYSATGNRQTDIELARRAGGGDAEAFEELHRRYRRLVYSIALRMTNDRADAEDLTQESFLSLFRKIGGFRGESSFATWLHRLTTNQVLMHFRRRKCRPEDQTLDGEMPELGGTGTVSPSGSIPVLERIAIERGVDALPRGYRASFILYDVEGYEHPEIARIMHCSEGTSKSQLHKARARLREMLTRRAPALRAC